MSKLLNKPFKAFTLYALIILACSIPVYYLVVDSIWLEELDEHNHIVKTRIEKRIDKIHFEENDLVNMLEAWNNIQPGTLLIPVNDAEVKPDRVYTVSRMNEYEDEMDRFRGLCAYVHINGKTYQLTIETNVEEADETLLAIAFVTCLFFVLLIVGFVLLNRRIAKKIWRPFHQTLDQLKTFDLGKHREIRFERSDIEEFDTLNQELNKLMERNISAFAQQKTFIENASHELQTPLALLKAKTDLLLQNKDLTGEQSEIVAGIHSHLLRVTRINKNLLLLAKIENQQFWRNDTVEVKEVLDETLLLLADYIEGKNMVVEKKVGAPLQISCNRTLFELLLNNLLINAIRHNTGNHITIALDQQSLLLCNPGTQALHAETLFKRFAVSSSETTNSGLGLAIVNEICNRYGWKITYTFESNQHSFLVRF